MRAGEPPDADAPNVPGAVFTAFHFCSQGLHGARRGEHIFRFEQAANARLPDRYGAQHEGAVRHGFVAGDANPALRPWVLREMRGSRSPDKGVIFFS